MNAISVSRRRLAEKDAVAGYDVDGCVRSWGRRGILSGGLIGFVLGAIFVANPITAGVLAFGIAGALIVCATECAVVAGGFGGLAAALYDQGVFRANAMGLERMLAAGRLPAGANWREDDVPLSGSNPTW